MSRKTSANIHIFSEIPPGWRVIHGATTAPLGYEFISNGKSRFSKEYKCGLFKCERSTPKAQEIVQESVLGSKETSPIPPKAENQSGVCFDDDPELPERLNLLAREEAKRKLLQDIAADIAVCRVEGWDYRDYLLELQEIIHQFLGG